MKCPICNAELVKQYHDSTDTGTCEYLYTCEDCKLYAEQFAYGGYEISIGNFVAHYAWNTEKEDRKLIDKYIWLISTSYWEKLYCK